MSYIFPSIPNAYFNIEKWFVSTFNKDPATGKTIGYDFNYQDHFNLFLHAKFTIEINSVRVINAFDKEIYNIPIDTYKKFLSCGEWDDPTFTKNERLLAWKIECLRNNFSTKSTISLNDNKIKTEYNSEEDSGDAGSEEDSGEQDGGSEDE